MKRIAFVLLYAALVVAASAQTIWVRTNEISGNVSPSESLTAVAGAIRLTVYSTDGGGSADLSGTAVRFLITDLRDDKVIVSNSPAVVVTNSVHRGEATLSAGSPYAVRLMAYPEGNDPYALYWATLTVTNPPSAAAASVNIDLISIDSQSISNSGDMYVGGTLTISNLNVGGAINVIDSNAVRRVGDTMGPLTSTAFYGSFNGDGAGQTNTAYHSSEWYTNSAAAIIAASSSGGAGGTIQYYTNAVGIWFTNHLGYLEPLRPNTIPSTDWTIFHGYDGPEELSAMSNLNVTGSAWTYTVTNGALWIVGPNESAAGRFFDLLPVTSGVWSRAAMHILVPLQYPYWVNGNFGYGLSCYDSGLTNSAFHGRRANSYGDNLETYIYNRSFSEGQDTRYVTPYLAGSATAYTYIWGYHDITLYGQHDGTNQLMWFISGSGSQTPARQYVATNTAPAIGWAIMAQCSSAAAGGTNSGAFGIDWFGVGEGLWFAPQ